MVDICKEENDAYSPLQHHSMERIKLVYYIKKHLLVNIGEMISEHIIAWVKHPCGLRPFPQLIERLCLKTYSTLEQFPQVELKDGVWTVATLHRIIAVHKNKAKFKRHKTKQDGKSEVEKVDEEAEDEKEDEEVPLKCKR